MKIKTTLFAIVALCVAISANAQKPFKEIGKDNEVNLLTLSNGRYIEYFTYDTLRQIGSVMFNTKTHKVEYFITENDTNQQHILARAKEASRFMSVDPLTKQFPELSPYQYASNTPIQAIDLDGLEAYYMIDGTRVGQYGTSTQVRLVNENVTFEQAQNTLANSDKITEDQWKHISETYSSDVGMNEAELNTRATLATIKVAEAGRSNPELDYNSWNGTDKFIEDSYEKNPEAYSKHPGPNPNRNGARAAGAYQMMSQFWKGIFSPEAQDKAAVKGLKFRGALVDAKKGDIVNVKEKVQKSQWTSFNNWTGAKLKNIFKKKVSDELQGKSKIATPKGKLETD